MKKTAVTLAFGLMVVQMNAHALEALANVAGEVLLRRLDPDLGVDARAQRAEFVPDSALSVSS